jgi:hypothetical protein
VAIDVLQQRAAAEDVDGLHAAAHAEHRSAAFLSRGPRAGLEVVAAGLDLGERLRRLAVERRIEVGAAGKQQAVHHGEGRGALSRRRRRVDQDGLAARVAHGIGIAAELLPGRQLHGLLRGTVDGDQNPGAPRHAAIITAAVRRHPSAPEQTY